MPAEDAFDSVRTEILKAIAKRRSYADHFDWYEKSLKEWDIAQTFKEELERDCGPLIASELQLPGGYEHLSPDYQLTTHSGEVWGVEVTELVSEEAIEQTKRGKNVVALWPDDVLVKKFRGIVAKKDSPKSISGGPYNRYVLLVHVDEFNLSAERFSAVLDEITFETKLIDNIYVLVSYDPYIERNPLLNLSVRRATMSAQS